MNNTFYTCYSVDNNEHVFYPKKKITKTRWIVVYKWKPSWAQSPDPFPSSFFLTEELAKAALNTTVAEGLAIVPVSWEEEE